MLLDYQEPHIEVSTRPSEPQPPEIEIEDNMVRPNFRMKQLVEIIKDEMVSTPLHKTLPSPDEDCKNYNIFMLFRLVSDFRFNMNEVKIFLIFF